MSADLLVPTTPGVRPGHARVIDFLARLGRSVDLVIAGDHAVMVDPQRDVEPYLVTAEEHGARLCPRPRDARAQRLRLRRARAGTTRRGDARAAGQQRCWVSPSPGARRPGHRGGRPSEIEALHTPGARWTTPATSCAIRTAGRCCSAAARCWQGSAGGTDLAEAALTDPLTAHQFTSVRRLAKLDPARSCSRPMAQGPSAPRPGPRARVLHGRP